MNMFEKSPSEYHEIYLAGVQNGEGVINSVTVPTEYAGKADASVYISGVTNGVSNDAERRLETLPEQTMGSIAIAAAAAEIAEKYNQFLEALRHYNILPIQEPGQPPSQADEGV